MAVEAFNKKKITFDKQAKLEHFIVQLRDVYTDKIEAEVFRGLQNLLLEENGEDKIVKECN